MDDHIYDELDEAKEDRTWLELFREEILDHDISDADEETDDDS